MCVISKKQDGFALLNTLILVLFLGIMGTTLATLLLADMRSQSINIYSSRAFYAARSGLEYAIRGFMEQGNKYVNLAVLHNYSEVVATGNGTRAKITINFVNNDSVRIKSVGYSRQYSRTIIKALNFSNVSQYAIYATGNVKNVSTIPNGKIKKYAKDMPFFDTDVLRNLAKPTQYFPGSLVIKFPFYLSKDITFVEKNLIFKKFSWLNIGNFVVGENVLIKKSPLPFGLSFGTMYLFGQHSHLYIQKQIFNKFFFGGVFVDGDVIGSIHPFFHSRLYVYYNLNAIRRLMRYSLNGGPIVVHNSTWDVVK